MTRNRPPPPDFSRLREALAAPGLDTRVWTSRARIDDDPDAVVWDDDLGWLVDVHFVGGPLDGDGPEVCRVSSTMQGDGIGIHTPPRRGALVQVGIPGGDVNVDPVVVGYLHDTTDSAPAAVNGDSITEAFALETHITVAPDHDLDQEWRNARITAALLLLGVADADQAMVRGDKFAELLDPFLDSLLAIFQAIVISLSSVGAAPIPVSTAGGFVVDLQQLKSDAGQWLSEHIKGD